MLVLDGRRVLLGERDVSAEIRQARDRRRLHVYAVHPAVREAMIARQRHLIALGGFAEGRDIGTVVAGYGRVLVLLFVSTVGHPRKLCTSHCYAAGNPAGPSSRVTCHNPGRLATQSSHVHRQQAGVHHTCTTMDHHHQSGNQSSGSMGSTTSLFAPACGHILPQPSPPRQWIQDRPPSVSHTWLRHNSARYTPPGGPGTPAQWVAAGHIVNVP